MGATKDRLREDLTTAMRAKDDAAKSTIRMMLAAIRVDEVAGDAKRELSDAEELAVLTREMRKRVDSAETYAAAGRGDLAEREASEAEFISGYLPAPLTESELASLVDDAIAALDEPPTMKQMGALVKAVSAQAEGRVEGKAIAAMVRSRLS